jgi:hypothetical protein
VENHPIGNANANRVDNVNHIHAVVQCQGCHSYWNRDVNAARYLFCLIRNIGIIFHFIVRLHVGRPLAFARPNQLIQADQAAIQAMGQDVHAL